MMVKKSTLYSCIWTSCNELRGGMDASQYKDYVLFMLFIKYISDKYADSKDFAPLVKIPKGASFKDMVAMKSRPDIGDRINKEVIQPLIDGNEQLASSDFPDFNSPSKLGEAKEMEERLSKLIAIFERPELDFSNHRTEQDDILGDAYEYLMRHFATESGKSKGQFYTPAEVSRVMAKVIGIGPGNTKGNTTAYDPTCGSGSLLLKVAAESGKHITLEGQEKDGSTAGLARMNMILHDFPTAKILSGNTLADPKYKDGEKLRTYDYVVANPPFSDKAWSTGLTLDQDHFQRFNWGIPPKRQGDYAYLLHIIRSMKRTGKAACILPHGVLFRGNAEGLIRHQLIKSGILKGIIGLPANLFYGTGIPACILVLDKENTQARKGVFMIDASRGYIKDGNKNRLREQDIHRIVDTFLRQAEVPRYARMVPFEEITDPKNDGNLNLPRYIDSTDPEDVHDISGHLHGGMPKRDIDALCNYWKEIPGVRSALFKSAAGRRGYLCLKLPIAEAKAKILSHADFKAFVAKVNQIFDHWKDANLKHLKDFDCSGHPKQLIEQIAEELLAKFQKAPLLDAYDVYQHLMDYWNETMQDDAYLIAAVGWVKGAQPQEISKARTYGTEAYDYKIKKRHFKSDLIPASLMIDRYFEAEREGIDDLESELANIEQRLVEMREEQGGEEGLLAEVIENEGDKQKITAKAIKERLKEIGEEAPDYADEVEALKGYKAMLDKQTSTRAQSKAAQQELDKKLHAKYPKLTKNEIQSLVVEDKWLATLADAVHGELDRVSQTLTSRIRELAERYAAPLPQIIEEEAVLSARVDEHLQQMGIAKKHDLKLDAMQQLLTGQTRLPGFSGKWQPMRFLDMLNYERPDKYLVDNTNYERNGDTPVLTANKSFILGYTNEALGVYDKNLPVIIFDDFTIDSKFVDFPFKVKSSAIKILKNRSININLKFVYCLMCLVRFPLGEHKRHYISEYQHIELPIPNLEEQTAIAEVLDDLDAEIAALEARRAKTQDLKQALMQELLTGKTRLVNADMAAKATC